MNRSGLEEMLFDAEARAFDTLLVFRVDRLSRKVRELAQMVDELTKYGVALKSITEPFDTTNAAGKMMLQMLGVFAEFEHATIVERTKVGMERKAKGGTWVGGVVPYGYQLDPEKGLIVYEEEAVVIRKMFKTYALGKVGTHTICHRLNDAGHPDHARFQKSSDFDQLISIWFHDEERFLHAGTLGGRAFCGDGNHTTTFSQHTPLVFRVAGDVCSAIDQDGGKSDPYCLGRRGSRNLFGVG